MQRKTVVISRDLYLMLKAINKSDRYIIWDLILDNLFDGKKPELSEESEYSESVKNAFICLGLELNKLQKQFENGKKNTQKKSTQNFTQSFCPFDDTQINPSKSNQIKNRPSTSDDINVSYNIGYTNNNNINNNKNNNIYNNIYNKQTNEINNNKYKSKDLCEFQLTQENRDIAEYLQDALNEKIKNVADQSPAMANRFSELVERVATQVRPLKVQGYYTAPEVILEKYLNLFCCETSEAVSRLGEMYSDIDEKTTTTQINNIFKYTVAYFYNKSCEL